MDDLTHLVCCHVVFPLEDLYEIENLYTKTISNGGSYIEYTEFDVVAYTQHVFGLINNAKGVRYK